MCESWLSGRRRRRRIKIVDSSRLSARFFMKVVIKKMVLFGVRES